MEPISQHILHILCPRVLIPQWIVDLRLLRCRYTRGVPGSFSEDSARFITGGFGCQGQTVVKILCGFQHIHIIGIEIKLIDIAKRA